VTPAMPTYRSPISPGVGARPATGRAGHR
jgi:hypothetical protein